MWSGSDGRYYYYYLNKFNADSQKLRGIEREFLLNQLIDRPTRISKTISSAIDLIFTTNKSISFSGPLNLNLSDHHPLIKKKREEKNQLRFIVDHIQNLITMNYLGSWRIETGWSFIYELNDPDTIWDKMYSVIIGELNIFCPDRINSVWAGNIIILNNKILLLYLYVQLCI